MILDAKGKLCIAQTIASAQTDDSDNVIQYAALDYVAMTDMWWVVDVNVVATGNSGDEYTFQLVMAKEAGLSNIKEVMSRKVIDFEDPSIATAGRHIIAVNLGKMLKDMLDEDGSDYPFIGMIIDVTDGGEIVIDASLSPTEPHTVHHKMAYTTNVTIPAVASVLSGESV